MPTPSSDLPRFTANAVLIAVLTVLSHRECDAQTTEPVELKGHLSAVLMGALTPDGDRAVTVGADETVRLWDVRTGGELRQYKGHTGPVYCVAISADGRTLVTGAQDNSVRVWDLPAVKPQFQIAAHPDRGSAFSLSPDGRFLVSAGGEPNVRLWDTAKVISQAAMNPQSAVLDGSSSVPRPGHQSDVQAIAYRADGTQFVTADQDGNMLLWSPFLDAPLGQLGMHEGGITSLAYHPDNTQLISGGSDGTVRVWQLPPAVQRSVEMPMGLRDVLVIPGQPALLVAGEDKSLRLVDSSTGQVTREFPAHDVISTSVAISPNASTVVAGDEQGQLRVLNFSDGVLRARIGGHAGAVRDVLTLPGDQQFVSVGQDGTIRHWAYPTAPISLAGHQQTIRAVSSAPSGQWVATVSDDKTLRLWSSSGQPVRAMTHPTNVLQTVSIRRDEQQVTAGDAGGGVSLWNVADGSPQGAWIAHDGATTAVEYDRTQPILWSGGADGTLKRWQLPIVPPRMSPGHSQPARTVATSGDGRWAISGSADQTVRLWDLTTGQTVRVLSEGLAVGGITAVAISSSGTHAAATTESGVLLVWSVPDGALIMKRLVMPTAVLDVTFLPDGKRLATLGQDLMIRHWQMIDAAREVSNDGAPYQVAASSPDGRRFAVAGTANGRPAIVVRDRETGQIVATLPGHEAAITSLAFNAGATRLISGSADKTARVWDLDANGAEVFQQTNHSGPVISVAIADDGQTAFSSAGESVVHHWQVSDGQEIRQIPGAASPVRQTMIRGGVLLVGSDDGTIRTVEIASGNVLRSLNHGGTLRLMDATRDGSRLLSVGSDRMVKCWKADDGTAVWSLAAASQEIVAMSVSPNGSSIGVASVDGIRVYDSDGRLLEHLESPAVTTQGLAWQAAGKSLVACGADGRCHLLPISTDQMTAVPDADSRLLAVSPDGRLLAVSGGGKLVRIWSVVEGRITSPTPIRSFTGAAAAVTDLAFSVDGAFLAVGSEDRTVAVWDTGAIASAGGEVTARMRFTQSAPVRVIAFSNPSSRKQLVSTGDDGLVSIWDLQTGKLAERTTLGAPQLAIAWGHGASIVVGGQDHQLRTVTSALLSTSAVVPSVPTDTISTLASCAGETAMIATTVQGQQLVRWKADGTSMTPVVAAPAPLKTLAVHADGMRVVAATADGSAWQVSLADSAVSGPMILGENVSSISLSRDGQEVVVADGRSRVRAISLATGKVTEEVALETPASLVQVTGAEGRQWVAAGVHPFAVVLNRNLIRQWEQNAIPANAVAGVADGTRIFVGFENGQIQQIRLADGVNERTFEAGPEAVVDVAFSAGGQRLYAAGRDKVIRVWTVNDGAQVLSIPHEQPVVSVGISGDNTKVASTTADGRLHILDAVTGHSLQTLTGHQPGSVVARWLSDSQTLITGSADKSLRTWKVTSLRSHQVHAQAVSDLVLTAAGAQILTTSSDGKVIATNAATGQTTKVWAENLADPRALALRPDGQRVAVGAADGTVLLWNGSGELLQKLETRQAVVSLAFSMDGTKLVVACAARSDIADDKAKLLVFGPPLPPQNPQPGNELILHQDVSSETGIHAVRFDRDGGSFWTSHVDGQLRSWSYAAPSFVRQFTHGGPVYSVAVSRDGSVIASGSADQTVRLWDHRPGQQRAQMSGHTAAVHSLAFTPDESLVVSASADRTIRLWDVTGGRQLKQLTTTEETMYSVSVHPNGQMLAMAGADRNVYLLNLLTGVIERTLVGHNDYIHSVAFNSQGTRLLSYGYAGTLRIWNPADGSSLLEQRSGRIGNSACYSQDGARVLSANGDGLARILELPANVR
ncbi:MAG: WD40 repeat domain-containing protein [Planctomycetota bacterium]